MKVKYRIVEILVKRWLVLAFLFSGALSTFVVLVFLDSPWLALSVVFAGIVLFVGVILLATDIWWGLWAKGEITSERAGFDYLLVPRPRSHTQDKQDYHVSYDKKQDN